jgi:hypothetical protein
MVTYRRVGPEVSSSRLSGLMSLWASPPPGWGGGGGRGPRVGGWVGGGGQGGEGRGQGTGHGRWVSAKV